MQKSGFRLFRIFGINVYLHWTWIIVALIEVQHRRTEYSSLVWNVAEYMSLFGIVLLHEMGHALACRSVGGRAERILLWPLGGVAFISPPQRPGALLWSIAAGPLVNVALVPVTLAMYFVLRHQMHAGPDALNFANALFVINAVLLLFNLFPAYPLDGGQILRALLWFVMGAANSLYVAAVIGIVGAVGVLALAASGWGVYMAFVAVFMGWQSIIGLRQALLMKRMKRLPRHAGAFCPVCGAAPPVGPFWKCNCGQVMDTFAHNARCPHCGNVFQKTTCTECHNASPRYMWHPLPPPPLVSVSGSGSPPPVTSGHV